MKVLLVEDDPNIVEMVRMYASPLQIEVENAPDGVTGLKSALSGQYQLVILDINLPGMNGLDICRELRRQRSDMPIVFLTSHQEEIDVVTGLELGADDYVTKPFRPREFVSRLRSVMSRYQRAQQLSTGTPVSAPASASSQPGEVVKFGDVEIDFGRLEFRRNGKLIHLTVQEWDLLETVIERAGRVFSREELIESIWGSYDHSYENLLTRVAYRLRQKVEIDPADPKLLATVHGVGYRWDG